MVPGSDRLGGGLGGASHIDIGGAATRKHLIWLAYRIVRCTARWIEMINCGGLLFHVSEAEILTGLSEIRT
jgi:hypothetical protein